MRKFLPLLLLFAASTPACVDSQGNCYGLYCEQTPPPSADLPLFYFTFETSSLQKGNAVAVGGRQRLTIVADGFQAGPPTVTSDVAHDSVLRIEDIASATTTTTVDLHALSQGEVLFNVGNNKGTVRKVFEARTVSQFSLVLPNIYNAQPTTRVLRGEPKLYAQLLHCSDLNCKDFSTDVLIDSSLLLLPASAAGIRQSTWDTLDLPNIAGNYPVLLQADSIGTLPYNIEVVEAGDSVDSEIISNSGGRGEVCFDLKRGADHVMTRIWNYVPTSADWQLQPGRYDNCVKYVGSPGATYVVEVTAGNLTVPINVVIPA